MIADFWAKANKIMLACYEVTIKRKEGYNHQSRVRPPISGNSYGTGIPNLSYVLSVNGA